MKKLFSICCCLVLSFIFLVGCKKSESYSCDPEINTWVKEHKSEIQKMDRSQLLNRSLAYQRAIFVALSPEKKQEMWVSKMDDVLRMQWTEQELEHLMTLKSYLNLDIFSSDAEFQKALPAINKWRETAASSLGWSNATIASLIASLETPVRNVSGVLSSQVINVVDADPPAPKPDCKCNKDDDYCNGLAGPNGPLRCGTASCKESTSGCGTLWLSACNGTCL